MAKKLNMDSVVDSILEWDFTLTYKGQQYVTKPITVAQVAQLQKTFEGGVEGGVIPVVESLFADPVPPVGEWRIEHLLCCIESVLSYWKEVTQKNSRSISAKVQAGMGASMSSN